MRGLAFNYKNSVNHKNPVVLLSFIVAAFLLSCLGSVSLAYNWEWDQGHYCTDVDTPDGMWGRWDYDGVYHGNQVSKECCELLCKICPVYANTGAFQKTYNDLSIPGVGPALQIIRTYSSQEWASTLLGYGWTFNLGRRLIILRNRAGDKIVGVRLRTGEKNFYKENPDGSLERLTDYGATYDLVKNEDETYTISRRNGSREEIQADGKISRIVDSNGNILTFEYNAVGCLARITNASGNYVDFVLGPNGKIASVADNLGRVVSYAYDDHGNLIVVTDPMGYSTQYLYNSRNLLTQIVDARGNTVHTISYNNEQPPKVANFVEKGEPYTISYYSDHTVKTDSHGNSWTYYFNDVGIITRVIDPLGNQITDEPNYVTATSLAWEEDANGNRTTFTWDEYGNKVSETDPHGNTTNYTYVSGTNWLETETDALGRVTRYDYDTNGNLIRITRDSNGPLENTTIYAYDALGNIISDTDPLGNTTTYEYDVAGNLIRVTDPLGGQRTYTYDARGNRLTNTDPNGHTTTIGFDLLDRMISVTDAEGNIAVYSYDANGNLVSLQYPDGNVNTYAYDAYGRLFRETDPLGNTRTFTHDSNDNLLTITDANGNTTTNVYDQLGRKIKTIDAPGNQTNFGYDANGNLISITDANGNTTLFAYDAASRLIRKTYADGAYNEYAYNAVGSRISTKDPNADTIQYQFDTLNRLVEKSYPDGSSGDFTYDLMGRMLSGTNTDSSLIYSYDALNRIIQTSLNGKTISYNYDAAGNRISMSTPEGETVQYSYDTVNHISRMQLTNGKGIDYHYDFMGRNARKDYTGGAYSTYTFDSSGRLTQINHLKGDGAEIYTQANTFNNVNNILSKTTELGITNYTYNNFYQLTSANHPTQPQEDFTYDPIGNRLTSSDYNNWSYNGRNELLSYDGVTFSYDSNGNTVSKTDASGTTLYTYNYENRLVKIDFSDGSYATYKYDVEGRRIEKNYNGSIISYLYDSLFLLAEYDFSQGLNRNYFYGPEAINPSILYEKGNVYFYHYDHLGCVQRITDEAGTAVWEGIYKVFGDTYIIREDVTNGFRFPGQVFDKETELFYNIYRYYDVDTGRYLTVDPQGFDRRLNYYVYALNDPINNIDPTGGTVYLCTKPIKAGIVHCYIMIGNSPTTSSYEWGFADDGSASWWDVLRGKRVPGLVRLENRNDTRQKSCYKAKGEENQHNCADDKVKDIISREAKPPYHYYKLWGRGVYNCCSWSRDVLSEAGLSMPINPNGGVY